MPELTKSNKMYWNFYNLFASDSERIKVLFAAILFECRMGCRRSAFGGIESFHYSNRTTLSLDSEALEGRLSTGCGRKELNCTLMKHRQPRRGH